MVQWTIFPPTARSRLIGLEQAGKKMVRWIFPPKCLIGPEQAGRLGRKKPPRGAACGD